METQVLTQLQLAKRLKISRTTEYELRRSGMLIEGKDYYKVGLKISYVLEDDCIEKIFKALAECDIER